jgi:hypothetical protein
LACFSFKAGKNQHYENNQQTRTTEPTIIETDSGKNFLFPNPVFCAIWRRKLIHVAQQPSISTLLFCQ